MASGWASTILQTTGGRYIAASIDADRDEVAYSWFEPGAAKLHLSDV
jgi:hypothetical protein